MRRALRTIKLFSSFFILLKVLQGLYRPDAVVALCRNGSPPTAGCCADIATNLPYRMAMVHRADCAHLKSCPPD